MLVAGDLEAWNDLAIPLADEFALADLSALCAHIDQLQALAALAAARLDATGAWAVDGSASMVAWLRANCGMTGADAKRLVRTGRHLERLPVTADAALGGTLSAAQVRAVTGALDDTSVHLFAEHEAELVPAIARLDARRAAQVCATWALYAEAVVERPLDDVPVPGGELSMARTIDGVMVGSFTLDTDGALQVEQAIATASRFAGAKDCRTPAQRRAEALIDVCAFFNANHAGAGHGRRHRPHIELIVHAADLAGPAPVAHTGDGDPVPHPVFDALACDSVLHRVLVTPDQRVDYGTSERSVPDATYRVVALRDGGCRFPGCDRPAHWCDAHHVVHWRHGGPTAPDNLVLLCGHHHRLVHRGEFALELHADARVVVTGRRGHQRTSSPSPPTAARSLVRRE